MAASPFISIQHKVYVINDNLSGTTGVVASTGTRHLFVDAETVNPVAQERYHLIGGCYSGIDVRL